MSDSVVASTARPISLVARMAAGKGLSFFSWMKRWMFSSTTMASSMTMPTASASASRLMVLRLRPIALISREGADDGGGDGERGDEGAAPASQEEQHHQGGEDTAQQQVLLHRVHAGEGGLRVVAHHLQRVARAAASGCSSLHALGAPPPPAPRCSHRTACGWTGAPRACRRGWRRRLRLLLAVLHPGHVPHAQDVAVALAQHQLAQLLHAAARARADAAVRRSGPVSMLPPGIDRFCPARRAAPPPRSRPPPACFTGSIHTFTWRLRPPMSVTWPTPCTVSSLRRSTRSAYSVISRTGRSAVDAPG